MILNSPDAESALFWFASQPWYAQAGLWIALIFAAAFVVGFIIAKADNIEWQRFRNMANIDDHARMILGITSAGFLISFVGHFLRSEYPVMPYAFIACAFTFLVGVPVVSGIIVAAEVLRASWRQRYSRSGSEIEPKR
jgi:threonine/homoserine/homoserine lactone efflux protein